MEHSINEKRICQSCGMPMKKEKDFGIEMNGDRSKDYCFFCFRFGKFTDDKITIEEKIDKLVKISVEQLGMKEEHARHMAETKLPTLKRWKK